MAETLAEILFHLEEMGSDLQLRPIKREVSAKGKIKTITDYKLSATTASLWRKEQYRLLRLLKIEIEHKDILHSRLENYLKSFENASEVKLEVYHAKRNILNPSTHKDWILSDSDEYTERKDCLCFHKKRFFELLKKEIENEVLDGYKFYGGFDERYIRTKVQSVLRLIVIPEDQHKIDLLVDSMTGFHRIVNKKGKRPIQMRYKIPFSVVRTLTANKIRLNLSISEAFKVFVALGNSGLLEPLKGITGKFYSELFSYKDTYSGLQENINPKNIYVYRNRAAKEVDDAFLKQYGLHDLGDGNV